VEPDSFAPLTASSISMSGVGEGVGVGTPTVQSDFERTLPLVDRLADAEVQIGGIDEDGLGVGEGDPEHVGSAWQAQYAGSTSQIVTTMCLERLLSSGDVVPDAGTTWAVWFPHAVKAATTRIADAVKRAAVPRCFMPVGSLPWSLQAGSCDPMVTRIANERQGRRVPNARFVQ
jgi:hypothetical protein